ncbi:haloacid dehalogenase-like hydrolase [Pigmentiphaga humi]|uniref:Histidinol-phosphatase n=1 Tax=Pigmentiphaga humi TaxID=2478468 RepID=A0A3P4B6P4_9BURK|nr:HAD family hydrolase [Pigmentiphaga humi]VCU71957.1 haloacid dehalogenase-like hydrolase [Pigmentiphaga humi]
MTSLAPSSRLALFDLDHTLLPLDSDYLWADFLARGGYVGDPAAACAKNEELMQRYDAGLLTAAESAEFMLGLLASNTPYDLARWHEDFMAQVIRPAITEQALALVRAHLEAGDLCAIATSTNTFVTAPIARAFGVPVLLGTVPEYAAGRYTGRMVGTPCFREGKVVRVNEWLAAQGRQLSDFGQSFFYSDSMNDVPLLEVVTDPVAVNPSPALRELASQRNWRIMDLFA